ncbi:MAG TPA: glycosyltransferase family 2 protein [Candidatus Methylacidiphilales bacterium]|jgi:dolichol-phosphate mannosyltransferase|nr:glycosyltransferase family 2 protein [Candidatus Methylacidiphilales bacterium]
MKKCVSIIIPIYNEESCLEALGTALGELAGQVEKRGDYTVEMVLVDDGSYDNTWTGLMNLAAKDDRIRLISFSRNFGHQAALTCGYRMAIGDAVVCMDADLQDPPEVVLDMIAEWEKGADIVYAIRETREAETFMKKATAAAFYRLYRRITSTKAPLDAGDFRLMSRRVVDAFNQYHEIHRYIRGMVGCLGFKTTMVKYHRKPRHSGVTKFSPVKMILFATDAIISSSTVPLRMIYMCGLLCALPVLAYLAITVGGHFLFGWSVETGWLSLILVSGIFGTLNLVCLGIMGEYVGRLYEQARDRPLYLIQKEYPAEGARRGF